MHLHNIERGKSGHPDYVNKFGFHVWTSCGSIPQKNAWKDDWKVKYYNCPVQSGTLKVSYFWLEMVTLLMVQTVVSHCLKALVVKNSVLHDFGFAKVSPAKQL